MKVDGCLIELDPKKKYIFILDKRRVSHHDILQFAKRKIKDGNIYLLDLDGVKIVENSDRVIQFTIDKGGE